LGIIQDRRASTGWLLFRKGSGKWVIGIVSLFFVLAWLGLDTRGKTIKSMQNLTPLEQVQSAVASVSELASPVESLPQPLQIRIEGLFEQVKKDPANKAVLLREIKSVLHRNFKGQEDCWSCPGTEYFDRYDTIVGSQESRKPIGLKEWIAMGDEAFENQRLDEARENYSEVLQIIDERVFQPEETIDTSDLLRMQQRCQQLKCR
jgi:hypothetical protein